MVLGPTFWGQFIYLLGAIFLIITNFALQVDLNKNDEKEIFGDLGMFKSSYSYEKQFYDMQIKRLQNILDGKETLTYMSADTGEIIETKSLREKDIKRINEKIQEYKDLISEPFSSPLDEYVDLETNKEFYRHQNIYNNSGPILLYNSKVLSQFI